MPTLKESNNTGNDMSLMFYGANWIAQTFQAASSYDITSVKLLVYRTGSPGTITVSIRATSAGLPDGLDLTSGTTNGDTLTTDTGGEWREITFSSTYALVSGTTYAIVVRATTGDLSNNVNHLGTTTDTEANGAYDTSGDSGSTWEASLIMLDSMFENYAADAGPANVKTYNAITSANTKTVNGITIANVKTKNGVA